MGERTVGPGPAAPTESLVAIAADPCLQITRALRFSPGFAPVADIWPKNIAGKARTLRYLGGYHAHPIHAARVRRAAHLRRRRRRACLERPARPRRVDSPLHP